MKYSYKINHRHLFLFGWVYYMLLPVGLGYAGIFDAADSFSMMSVYFDLGSPYWSDLLFYYIGAPVMYLMGSRWAPLYQPFKYGEKVVRNSFGSWILLLTYALLLVIFALQARPLIGAGYMGDVDLSAVGPIATLQMVILFQYLYERSAGNYISKWFSFLLIINSILLLSMGGRLYVLAALISCYVRWWNWAARSRMVQLRSLSFLLCVPLGLVILGMWRVDDTDYSLVGFYLVAESVFSSISSFTLFASGEWSGLLSMPHEFIGAFANTVPSILWPDKAEWMSTLVSANQKYESPFGAVSIVASTLGNFGFVGGLMFFLFVGFYMTLIGRTRGVASREAYYYYLMGLIPFMFFRDPFQIQIKIVLTGLILYGIAALLTPRVTKSILNSRNDDVF